MEVKEPSAMYLVKPAYKQTDIGAVPEDWDVLSLGAGIKLMSGHHVLARYCNSDGEGVAYLTGPADFPEGLIKHTKYTTRPGTVCAINDILLTVKGSGVGTIVFADNPYCISRQLMAVRVGSWTPAYIYYILLKSSSMFSAAATGLIPGLSRDDILSKKVALPPTIAEQQAIATALSDADALIEALEQLLTKKRQIKQGAMQELLTGQRRLPGFSGEWRSTCLGAIGTFSKGAGVTRDQALSGMIPCVRYGEIYTSHDDCIREFYSWISEDVSSTSTRLRLGDLLFAGSGETKEDIGKCVAFLSGDEAYAGGDIVILRPVGCDSTFLGYALNTAPVVRQKASFGQGDAVVHISAAALARVVVQMPAKAEQTAIATILSDIDAEITTLEAKLTKARHIKQGMMQELLTGRIRLV